MFFNSKRFSFLYGGKDIFSYKLNIKECEMNGDKIFEYTTDDGLKLTHILKRYDEFDAAEWVTWFENTSDKPSKVLSKIYDCDIDIPFSYDENLHWCAYIPERDMDMKIYCPYGSLWNREEFYCNVDEFKENRYVNHIYPNQTHHYKTSGGRSSQAMAPFFNIHRQNKGVVFAVGWTGQWQCDIKRTNDSVNIKSGIEDAEFYLLPGEKIRTSSAVLMEYEGSCTDSQNKWRRLIKKHFSLIGKPERPQQAPLCAGIWGGMSTKAILERIDIIQRESLPFEYIWMDAGWNGTSSKPCPDEFQGDWGDFTGDWRVNKNHHPDGLLDVKKAISAAGLKFLLWFEPERVRNVTPIAKEHPEYFLIDKNSCDYLLNLGNPDALNYCINTLSERIETLGIDFYRQDFNFDPLDRWRVNDSENRNGITEIKHIMGLYKLWDSLLERFPTLCIDNCASGGRRIDIETLRRSVPLWRSDFQCPANYSIEYTQSHNMQFSTWMTYSGTGSGREWGDVYRIRSAYAGSLTTNYTFSEAEKFGSQEQVEWLKTYLNEYLSIRKYFYCDFYPLTDSVESEFSWNVSQFNCPENGDGMVQAFRHEKSPFAVADFKLSGLDASKTYRITDLDDNSFYDASGEDLMNNGINIKTASARSAKIYVYKAL